jgi:hypothetical protein
MNELFSSVDFWMPYLTLEPGNLKEEDFAAQRKILGADFKVRDVHRRYTDKGKSHPFTCHYVDFVLSCGPGMALVLQYETGQYGCEQYLYLLHDGTKSEMGWWDLARWHPYCLRPEELELLIQYWSRFVPKWPAREVPTLLLAKFVGLPDNQIRDRLSVKVEAAWQSLGLGSPLQGESSVLELLVEDGYKWMQDQELGWVFHSDEYCCYSIRNRPHSRGEEGRFPFRSFQKIMAHVEHQLES